MTRLARNSKIRDSELKALHPEISRWALYCVDFNHDLGKETVQQVYLKLMEGTAAFSGKSSLKTWLYGVVRNTANEIKRSRQAGYTSGREHELVESSEAGADTLLQEHHARKAIGTAIAELSLVQREIIYLVFYKDMTLADIAGILGISVGAVRKQYHRAKSRLAVLLDSSEENDIAGTFYEKSYS